MSIVPDKPDTQNDFWFGSNGRAVTPTLPVQITTRQQAYRTAAWIEIMGMALPDDGSDHTFDQVREAVLDS